MSFSDLGLLPELLRAVADKGYDSPSPIQIQAIPAVLAGRAIAQTWRPWWQIVAYMLILGAAVRFIHFALFGGTLLSLHYYVVDSAICLLFGLIGFQAARAAQMVSQYRWINQPNGPLRWRRKAP